MAWIEFIRELIHILSDKVTATIYFKMYLDKNLIWERRYLTTKTRVVSEQIQVSG